MTPTGIVATNSASAPSLSSTPGAGGTPSAHHPRVAHLRRDSIRRESPGPSSKDADLNVTPNNGADNRRQSGTVTPARFMDPDASYHPDYDVEGLLDALKTPETPAIISPTTGQARKHARKNSVPLDVLYEEAMNQAIANTQGRRINLTMFAESFYVSPISGITYLSFPLFLFL